MQAPTHVMVKSGDSKVFIGTETHIDIALFNSDMYN